MPMSRVLYTRSPARDPAARQHRALGGQGRRGAGDSMTDDHHSELPHGGWAAPGYEGVEAEFAAGLSEFGRGGGGFAAYVAGKPVVDVWGGYAKLGQPWTPDSLAVIMSATKGFVTLCAQILVDRQELEVDAPVARYWPEFSQCGK